MFTASLVSSIVPGRPVKNRVVILTIKDIRALDGSELSEPIELQYITTLDPHYTNVMRVRMIAGEFIQDVPDDALELLISQFSIQAETLNYRPEISAANPIYPSLRDRWVAASVVYSLVSGTAANAAMSKRLGDLSVTRSRGAEELLENLRKELEELEDMLQDGGDLGRDVVASLRGDLSPDAPIIGRQWATEDTHHMEVTVPGANTAGRLIDRRTGQRSNRLWSYFKERR